MLSLKISISAAANAPRPASRVYFVIIVGLSIGIGVAVRIAVVWAVRKLVRLRDGFTGRQLLEQHVVQKCSHFIAPLVFLGLMPFAVDAHSTLMRVLMKIVLVYAILAVAYGIASVLTFVFVQVNTYRNKRNLPLKGVLNVALGILFLHGAVVLKAFADKLVRRHHHERIVEIAYFYRRQRHIFHTKQAQPAAEGGAERGARNTMDSGGDYSCVGACGQIAGHTAGGSRSVRCRADADFQGQHPRLSMPMERPTIITKYTACSNS